MADLGRTYQSKREPAHMASEASRLRGMVQEQKGEIERMQDVVEAAYVMLDRFAGDMSDEAYAEIESILGNALEEDFPTQSRLQKLAQDLAGEKEVRKRYEDTLEQIALRKEGFIIPVVVDGDATWKDAVDALREHARNALDGGGDDNG